MQSLPGVARIKGVGDDGRALTDEHADQMMRLLLEAEISEKSAREAKAEKKKAKKLRQASEAQSDNSAARAVSPTAPADVTDDAPLPPLSIFISSSSGSSGRLDDLNMMMDAFTLQQGLDKACTLDDLNDWIAKGEHFLDSPTTPRGSAAVREALQHARDRRWRIPEMAQAATQQADEIAGLLQQLVQPHEAILRLESKLAQAKELPERHRQSLSEELRHTTSRLHMALRVLHTAQLLDHAPPASAAPLVPPERPPLVERSVSFTQGDTSFAPADDLCDDRYERSEDGKSSGVTSVPTVNVPLYPTEHADVRAAERDILFRERQSAKKHGRRTRVVGTPTKEGSPTWKYTHNGVTVVLLQEDTTREITCVKTSGRIAAEAAGRADYSDRPKYTTFLDLLNRAGLNSSLHFSGGDAPHE